MVRRRSYCSKKFAFLLSSWRRSFSSNLTERTWYEIWWIWI
jgi:hypothetical protein